MRNLMKRVSAFLAVLVMCTLCILPAAYGAGEYANAPVTDKAGFLTGEELSEVTAMLNNLRERYAFDTVIYTEKAMSGVDAQNTADDIFNYYGYGYGTARDGIILYVSQEPRKYHFSTHGAGIEYFNDAGLRYIEGEILPYLKANDYYGAFKTYAQRADELLAAASQGIPYGTDDTIYRLCVIAGAVLLPLIGAGIMTGIRSKRMNTANRQNYASSYVTGGGVQMNEARDIFMYSTVSKTPKPKENSSSTHRSSSGEVHGGRGGSY